MDDKKEQLENQRDRCLQVIIKSCSKPERIRAVDIVLSIWNSSLSADKKRKYADMLFENDNDGSVAAYFLGRFSFDDSDKDIAQKAFSLVFEKDTVNVRNIISILKNYRMPSEAAVRFSEMIADNREKVECSLRYEIKEKLSSDPSIELALMANSIPGEARRAYVRAVAGILPETTVPNLFQESSPGVFSSGIDVLMENISYMNASSHSARTRTMRFPEKVAVLSERLFQSDGDTMLSVFGYNAKNWGSLVRAALMGSETRSGSSIGLFMSNILSTVKKRKTLDLPPHLEIRLMGFVEKFLNEHNDREGLALAKDFLHKTCRNILTSTNDAVRHSAELVVDLIVSMENELMLSGPADPEDENLFPGGQITEEFYSSGVVF